MKGKITYQQKTAHLIMCGLLAMLFLAMPMVQALHLHPSEEHVVKNHTEQSISSTAEKCMLCQYANHFKGKQFFFLPETGLDIPTQVCTTLNTFVYTRIYKFTLQNFSNKGPPAYIS